MRYMAGIAETKRIPKPPDAMICVSPLVRKGQGEIVTSSSTGSEKSVVIDAREEVRSYVCTVQFSLGPKGPPRKRPRRPDSGRILERGLRMA